MSWNKWKKVCWMKFDFRQIDQLSGETELGEKVRFRDLTEMLISGNTKELGERFLEIFFRTGVLWFFRKEGRIWRACC